MAKASLSTVRLSCIFIFTNPQPSPRQNKSVSPHQFFSSYYHLVSFSVLPELLFQLCVVCFSLPLFLPTLSLHLLYMEVHFQRNPNPMGEMVSLLEEAVMTTPTLLLQSQLIISVSPTPPSCTKRGLQGDTQGTSPHPAGLRLVQG